MIMATYTAIEVRLLLFCGKHVESKTVFHLNHDCIPIPLFIAELGCVLYTAIGVIYVIQGYKQFRDACICLIHLWIHL